MIFLQILFLSIPIFAAPRFTRYCGYKYEAQKVADNQPYVLNHPDDEQKFDLYVPKGAPKPYKTIVLFHGGCFQYGDKADGEKELKEGKKTFPMATENQILKYVRAGYAVASVDYRLAKPDPVDPAKSQNKFPTALDDVRDAWCYLQKYGADKYGLDTDHMVASGHSAGSTLAELIGSNHTAGAPNKADCEPKVAGVVGMSGRTIFTKHTEKSVPTQQKGLDCGEGFVGEKRDTSHLQEPFLDLNLPTHIDPAKVPPFHLTHGSKDDLVDISNSEELCKAMPKTCKVKTIKGAGHMYEKPGEMDEAFESNCEFLETEIFGPKPTATATSPAGAAR